MLFATDTSALRPLVSLDLATCAAARPLLLVFVFRPTIKAAFFPLRYIVDVINRL